jgi:hypothetical protein
MSYEITTPLGKADPVKQALTEARLAPKLAPPPTPETPFLQNVAARISGILRPTREPIFILADLVHAHDPGAAPNKEELKTLREMESEHRALWELVNIRLTRDEARKAWTNIGAETAEKMAAGAPVPTCTFGSFDAVAEHYEGMAGNARIAMGKIAKSAEAVCLPIAKRFLAGAKSLSKQKEEAERNEALMLGMEPNPPAIVLALRKIIRQLQVRENFFQGNFSSGPSKILFWVEQIKN